MSDSDTESVKTNKVVTRIADWTLEKEQLSSIRRQVFIIEQKVPEELEWDEFDDSAMHFIATRNDIAIGTARLKSDGQIGRMAVLQPYRNQGIGNRLLKLALETARSKQYPKVYLHAQVDAIPFYEKHGFTSTGEIFYEASIPHRSMFRNLC